MLVLRVAQTALGWAWQHRRALIALILLLALVTPRPAQAQLFLSNSFGFGGMNAVLAVRIAGAAFASSTMIRGE